MTNSKEYFRKYREHHREELNANNRRYVERMNNDPVKREQYKKRRKAAFAKWMRENRTEALLRKSARKKNHQHKYNAYESKRRALKRQSRIGNFDAVIKVYERAKWWRQWFNVVVDHIVPLIKGGAHDASNLQIIYESDNARKHASLNYKPRVIFV